MGLPTANGVIFVLILSVIATISTCNGDLKSKLEQHLETLDYQLSAMTWFQDTFYMNRDKLALEDVEDYVSNPVNVYAMIQRLSDSLPQVLEQLKSPKSEQEWQDILNDIDNHTKEPSGDA